MNTAQFNVKETGLVEPRVQTGDRFQMYGSHNSYFMEYSLYIRAYSIVIVYELSFSW